MSRKQSVESRSTEIVLLSIESQSLPDEGTESDLNNPNEIQLLSSQIVYLADPHEITALQEQNLEKPEDNDNDDRGNQRASRFVTFVAVLLLGMCVGLISASFILSSSIDEVVEIQNESPRRKFAARVVVGIAVIFAALVCILLGVSFSMSKNIDDMVRDANVLLREHKMKSSTFLNRIPDNKLVNASGLLPNETSSFI